MQCKDNSRHGPISRVRGAYSTQDDQGRHSSSHGIIQTKPLRRSYLLVAVSIAPAAIAAAVPAATAIAVHACSADELAVTHGSIPRAPVHPLSRVISAREQRHPDKSPLRGSALWGSRWRCFGMLNRCNTAGFGAEDDCKNEVAAVQSGSAFGCMKRRTAAAAAAAAAAAVVAEVAAAEAVAAAPALGVAAVAAAAGRQARQPAGHLLVRLLQATSETLVRLSCDTSSNPGLSLSVMTRKAPSLHGTAAQ